MKSTSIPMFYRFFKEISNFSVWTAEIEFLKNICVPWNLYDKGHYLLLTVSIPFPNHEKTGLIRVQWTTTAVVATALLTFLTPGLIPCSYACSVTPTTLSNGLANLCQKIVETDSNTECNLQVFSVDNFNRSLAKIFHSWFTRRNDI